MSTYEIVVAETPVHITHDTYKRECRYTRGIHIPLADFENILKRMCQDTKTYFEFHNVAKPIQEGSFLNGHARLAKVIAAYYLEKYNERIHSLQDGRDFYVKII